MKIFVTLFLALISMSAIALPHNYDLPFNCIDSGALTNFQQSKKAELEGRAIPMIKQLMKEGGQMAGLFAISYKGRELSNCAIGYADYDSGERLAKGLLVLPLQANAAARGASLAKPITRAAIKKCVDMGLCDYNENLLAASGVKPWGNTVQPWHSQCTVRHAVEPVTTACNIPTGIEGSDIDVAKLAGYSLPLSFANRLSYDASTNTARLQPTSNLAYMLLGAMIERKTGRNYYDWVHENITDKAGISRESLVQSLGTLQLMGKDKDGKPMVVNGREPGEISYDSRFLNNDLPDYRISYYDGKTVARNSDSGLVENLQAAAGWTGTTDAWLRFVSDYSDDGTYAPMKNGAYGVLTDNGEFFGTSTIMYRTPNGDYAFVLNFNRYSTVADGNVISTAAWLKLRAILDATDLSSYTYDLWDIGTTADQVVRSYTYNKAGVFRYFAASPAAVKVLDDLIAKDPSVGFTRNGESWKMWKVGTSGTVPVCRYFYPPASTHFWCTYEDCKLVQMLFPNQENYIDTFHFEEMTLAAKWVNPTTKTCDAPTVPLYRGFRSVSGAQNHQYVVSGSNAINTAVGYELEGIALCVMPN